MWSPAASAHDTPSHDAAPWTSITFGTGGTGPAATEVARQYRASQADPQRGLQQKTDFLHSSAAEGTYLDVAALDYLRFQRPDGEVAEVVAPSTYQVTSIDFGSGLKPGPHGGGQHHTVSAAVHGTEHPDNENRLAYPSGPGFDTFSFWSKGRYDLLTSRGSLEFHWEKQKDLLEPVPSLDYWAYKRHAVAYPAEISGANDVVESMGMRSYPTADTQGILNDWADWAPDEQEYDADCSTVSIGVANISTDFSACSNYTVDRDRTPSHAGDMSFNLENCYWLILCDDQGPQSMATVFSVHTNTGGRISEPVYNDYLYVNFMINSRSVAWKRMGDGGWDSSRNHTAGCGATYTALDGITKDCGGGGCTCIPGAPGDGTGTSGSPAEPALVYQVQSNEMKIYRWYSTGSNFTRASDYHSGIFYLSQVGNRVASGDVDGDGDDDIVMAYQNSDGTFSYYVFKNGKGSAETWYTSGTFDLNMVSGRLVVADFTGDGKAEPAMAYYNADGTQTIYRWQSTGSSFNRATDYEGAGIFRLSKVGDRMAAADVTGDGKADIVMAYQNSDGTFSYYVWKDGLTSLGVWYTSGTFNLDNVQGRLVVANFTGDGKAEPAMAYYNADGTQTIYRWQSTGSSFTRTTDYLGTGIFRLSDVGDRVAAGDVTGDGKADIVMAYQNSDGTFSYYVWKDGLTSSGVWYKSGNFPLANVGGRMVVGKF
ncbi:FG-GAP repeat domain-containing protein [Catellatospora tritici]|uniref:FG-GAP repeat domain-containing protein n=1 Tax=Catellatospora tritici TaxID=2851566 RepID=UPI001C2DF0BC|nr:VCBS repeat-containing protein [Catellatospora tritici]MBV1849976.1 VCBS repeat-containing protein [Catellatospora tritici]